MTRHFTTIVLLTLLGLAIGMAPPCFALDTAVGIVTRAQAPAHIGDRPLRTGDGIFMGNAISTGEKGRVEITFKDQTSLIVGGDSVFIIDEFSYLPDSEEKTQQALFRLTKGAFRMVTSSLIDKAPDNFAVKTPLAVIGIRGTEFWGGYLSPIEFDIIMLQGKGVSITSMGGTVIIDEPGVGVSIPDPENTLKATPKRSRSLNSRNGAPKRLPAQSALSLLNKKGPGEYWGLFLFILNGI